VVAPLDEIDAPRVAPGQPARVSLDAFPGTQFPGTVRRVAPYVLDLEKQARTVDVEVDLNDAQSIAGLVPGYSADVEVLIDAREDVLWVPTSAVTDATTVLVLRDGRIERRAIETGISNWDRTEVRSGLSAGERVLTSLDRAGVADGAAAVAEAGPGG
jgi:HlyD family secretion protein